MQIFPGLMKSNAIAKNRLWFTEYFKVKIIMINWAYYARTCETLCKRGREIQCFDRNYIHTGKHIQKLQQQKIVWATRKEHISETCIKTLYQQNKIVCKWFHIKIFSMDWPFTVDAGLASSFKGLSNVCSIITCFGWIWVTIMVGF